MEVGGLLFVHKVVGGRVHCCGVRGSEEMRVVEEG